mmetsp:Transcript_99076/g.275875  ORF Transcript_99076/g.275875 Transcript_99076/m.275875 type:complete len:95 (-) Transcript_99076:382-666(-)
MEDAKAFDKHVAEHRIWDRGDRGEVIDVQQHRVGRSVGDVTVEMQALGDVEGCARTWLRKFSAFSRVMAALLAPERELKLEHFKPTQKMPMAQS